MSIKHGEQVSVRHLGTLSARKGREYGSPVGPVLDADGVGRNPQITRGKRDGEGRTDIGGQKGAQVLRSLVVVVQDRFDNVGKRVSELVAQMRQSSLASDRPLGCPRLQLTD